MAFSNTAIYKVIIKADNFKNFIRALQILFWVLEEENYTKLKELAKEVEQASQLTPAFAFRVAFRKGKVTLYPSGAKLLDQKMVDETLEWLQDYPNVVQHYKKALQIYMEKGKSHYRELLDNLRLTVEQLLRKILGNRKSLENQEGILPQWLKQRGTHQEIVNMFRTMLFNRFAPFQNERVKHNVDQYSDAEVEFLIYLTGIFVRLLIEVSKMEPIDDVKEN